MPNIDNIFDMNHKDSVIIHNSEIIENKNYTDFNIIEIKENRKELNLFTLDFNH